MRGVSRSGECREGRGSVVGEEEVRVAIACSVVVLSVDVVVVVVVGDAVVAVGEWVDNVSCAVGDRDNGIDTGGDGGKFGWGVGRIWRIWFPERCREGGRERGRPVRDCDSWSGRSISVNTDLQSCKNRSVRNSATFLAPTNPGVPSHSAMLFNAFTSTFNEVDRLSVSSSFPSTNLSAAPEGSSLRCGWPSATSDNDEITFS